MAYSLTVAGYTFENPPEEYRKLARLSNSPQTAFNRRSTAFFQSDSQDLQFQVEGTLALDPPLGEPTDDLDELERLQEIAIEGGEVEVEFDPFFSGNAVIEDDPFRQSDGESSYQFTFSVNSEDTDDTAYPSHSSPDTGNTFELGDLDLGYDPSEVSQNYERQTEKVKRLQGIARTVDTEGLIPKVNISGLIDGGGQADLWDKARANTLAYLEAEFQNGWVLMDTLSIRNAPEAPDYLTGLFRYDLDLLVVMDPASGIGEVSKYVDQDVKESTQYVSNCDEDGVLERLGNDTEDYPYALDYRISGGTGKLNGEYLEWQEDFGTLDQSTTNYIWVEDPDGNGYGQVNTGTSGFPGNSLPLYEVDTSTSSVDAIRDQRACLTGTRLEGSDLGDLNFSDDLAVSDDQFSFERLLALADQMAVSDPVEFYRGIARFTDTFGIAEGPLEVLGSATFGTESVFLDDGGSAITGGKEGTTLTWDTHSDWEQGTDSSTQSPSGYGQPAFPVGSVTLLIEDNGSQVNSYGVGGNPSGIAVYPGGDGGNGAVLNGSDGRGGYVEYYDQSGNFLKDWAADEGNTKGICYHPGRDTVFTINDAATGGNSYNLAEYDHTGTRLNSWAVASNQDMFGGATDGTHLYLGDINGVIYKFDVGSGSPVKNWNGPFGSKIGLGWNGQYLIVLDEDTGDAAIHDPATESNVATFTTGAGNSGGGRGSEITAGYGYMWLADRSSNVVRKYPVTYSSSGTHTTFTKTA